MADVRGTHWEPFKRRWEGLQKNLCANSQSHGNPLGTVQTLMCRSSPPKKKSCAHMADVRGTHWEPFKRRWEGLQRKMCAHSQSHGNPLGIVQTLMGIPPKAIEWLMSWKLVEIQYIYNINSCRWGNLRISWNLLGSPRISRNLPGWRNFD